MSVLHPWALALAALAIVPLALHLVRREARRRVPFPALRYLRSAESRHARSLRVRDRWLAATRVALLLCLAVAASRPLVGRGGPASHPPTDVALVVDNTASMQRVAGGSTLLAVALEAARRTIALATQDDRFWVATPLDGLLAAGVGPAEAGAALDAIRGSDAAGSLPDAARDAASAMPADGRRPRELQLFTDGQRASLGGDAELDPEIAVALFRPRPDAGANDAVLALAVHPSPPVPVGTPVTVTVRVGSWPAPEPEDADRSAGGPVEDDGTPVRLLVDGELVAAARAAPGEDAALAVPFLDPGPHVLRAEIDPSGMRADDGRQVGVQVDDPVRVAIPVGPEAAFLARALETLAAAGRVRTAGSGERPEVRFQAGEFRPAPGAPGPSPATLVLVPPADPLGLPALEQALAAAGVPWRLEPDPLRGELRLAGDLP
ncbi:MAG: BatA domain-containing protein, partial [Gemmatimonadota bacterium]